MNPIAAGNAVILKTSEFSPKTQTNIAQLFYDAGLPTGVLNTIHVSPKDAPTVVKALIEHPFIRKVNFTGEFTKFGEPEEGPYRFHCRLYASRTYHRFAMCKCPETCCPGARRKGTSRGHRRC